MMTEGAGIKEIVEFINASFPIDWEAEAAHIRETQGVSTNDPIPVTVVIYYPFCDCGEPVLEKKVLMCKEMTLYGYGYMETCYECAVVSSD